MRNAELKNLQNFKSYVIIFKLKRIWRNILTVLNDFAEYARRYRDA